MTQDRELLEEMFENLKDQTQEKTGRKKGIVLGVFCSLCIGLYLFFLLFGNNSWSALLKLKTRKTESQEQVKRLQEENVSLQKIIFELRGLEPINEES